MRFPDRVAGRMWRAQHAEHGRVKYVLAAEFESAATKQVVARASQTGAFVALNTLRPVRLPEEYRT